MSDTSGAFPKVDGYHLWSDEINYLNYASREAIYTYTGSISTNATSFIDLKLVTCSMPASRNYICNVSWETYGDSTNGVERTSLCLNSAVTNQAVVFPYAEIISSNGGWLRTTVPVRVSNGDVLHFVGRGSGSDYVELRNIYIYCGGYNFTASSS